MVSLDAYENERRYRKEICAGVRDIALTAADLVEAGKTPEARRTLRNLASFMDALSRGDLPPGAQSARQDEGRKK